MSGRAQAPFLLVAMIAAGACGGAAQLDAPVSGEIALATQDADEPGSPDAVLAADAMPVLVESQEPPTKELTSVPVGDEDATAGEDAPDDAEHDPEDAGDAAEDAGDGPEDAGDAAEDALGDGPEDAGGDGPQDRDGDAVSAPTTTVPAVRLPPLRLPEGGPVMYLTFDDGPDPVYTPQVLDVLARHEAAATFFVLGTSAAEFPALIDRIVAEGHTVANHTWNHESLAGLSKESFDSTVSRTQALLGTRATPCLRPPYGRLDAFTEEWAAEHGLRLMLWNVDPADWQRPSAETIADHIVEHARPGAVVLLHDGGGDRSSTVAGLDMALQHLAGSGLRFAALCR